MTITIAAMWPDIPWRQGEPRHIDRECRFCGIAIVPGMWFARRRDGDVVWLVCGRCRAIGAPK